MGTVKPNVRDFIPYKFLCPILAIDVKWKDHHKKKGINITDLSDGCLTGCMKWLESKGHANAWKILLAERSRRMFGLMPQNVEDIFIRYQRKPEHWRVEVIFYVVNPN